MGSMTIGMRGGAPDRIAQGGAVAVLHHTPCFDAKLRRRSAKVPMRFGWPVIFRPLEDGGDFGLPLLSNGFRNNRFERPVIAVSTRWEPDRYP